MYENIYTLRVPGIYHKSIRGIQCHFSTFPQADALLSSSMLVAVNPLDFSFAPQDLVRISSLHGRS